MTKPIDGIKDNIDVKAVYEAFQKFKDIMFDYFNNCEDAIVDLAFDTSLDKDHHFTFKQDEVVHLNDIKINDLTKKLMFLATYGASTKPFDTDDAALISLTLVNDYEIKETKPLDGIIREAFSECFAALKINSVPALQAMCKNNPGLVKILNDDAFLDKLERVEKAAASYGMLEKFGLY